MSIKVTIDHEKLSELCRRRGIREIALFGSVLRDDFRPDSDIDVLVTFEPDAQIGLFEFVAIRDELAEFFGRKVDLLTRSSVEKSHNWIRRKAILGSAEVIHAA